MTTREPHAIDPGRSFPAPAIALLPGLALTALLAATAFALHALPGLALCSPMILAILLAAAFHNLIGAPDQARAGATFAQKRILRLAIALLGLQLTAAQVASVGGTGVAIIAVTLVATFCVTAWLGRLMGVDRQLSELIAAGTSICGASAVIATNSVTEAPEEEVAYAIGCVTVFGSVAMFAYPFLADAFGLSAHAYGLWAGASIHEIAQVVAAGYQRGQEAGEFATISKLSRVILLAPVVVTLGMLARRRLQDAARAGEPRRKTPIPWFVLGFVALVGVNSLVEIPDDARHALNLVTVFMLTMALAAMGLAADFGKLRAKGLKPFALGLASFLFISSFSLTLIWAAG